MMVARLVLVASVFFLVLGDETSQMRDELVPAKDLQSNDKDNLNSERRQSRLSRQTELPSSKAKREQVLRNFLAARKRHFSPRPPNTTKGLVNSTRSFKSSARNVSKDQPDMLEAQETRHGVYITVSTDDQSSSTSVDSEKNSENPTTTKKPTAESTGNVRREPIASRIQKNTELDNTRRKNIVPMSESVYNHFRPVESNIPVEDMTQFLYFGQKIQPENTTGNNSVEITTPTSSRRRFFVKGASTTPSIGRLEEIMNEKMNTAVEKITAEKNKISKTKNIIRSTSLYSRKIPQSIKTSESNIIIVNRTSDQSAHAQDQVDQRTTYATHRLNVSTQIAREPHQRTVATRGNESESENLDSNVVTSTISANEDDLLDYQNDSNQPTNVEKNLRNSAGSAGTKKNQSATMMMDHSLKETKKTQDQRPQMLAKSVQLTGESITPLQTTAAAQEKSRISTWLSLSADPLPPTATTINWSSTASGPRPQTLRIVVTEAAQIDEKYQSTARPSDSTTVQVNLSSVAVTLPRPDTPVAQQMHPYTYTITNVTRLLGNYSGPGSNDRTTTEAVGSSFPPLSGAALEALEPARTPDPVSVSPAVVETTSVSSPPPPPPSPPLPPSSSTLALVPLVGGERGRKGTSLRVVERNTSVHLESPTTVIIISSSPTRTTITTTTPTTTTTTDRSSEKLSTLRWNPARSVADDADREVASERRYLRKSASAVLNQRVDDTLRELKRRRVDAARRIKGLRSEDKVSEVKPHNVEHEVIEMLANKTLAIESSKLLDNQTLSDNVNQTQMKKLKMINELEVDRSSLAISDNDRLNFTANSTLDNSGLIVNNSSASVITPLPVIESTSRPVTASTKRSVPVLFPVTPIMFDSSNTVTKEAEEDKEHTRKKLENPAPGSIEPNKSLEITKDLVVPEVSKVLDSEVKSMMHPKMERKPVPERSPEVRGRNLSDKTKDKDDVLPIMHLYNTSDIFNGTLKDNEAASVAMTRVPEVSGVEPLQVQPVNSNGVGKKPTEDVPSDSYDQVSDSKEGRTSVSTKTNKNRQEINREAMQNSTYRTVNASASVNRTKYRPIYYSGPPESSGYHPEMNRTVFQDDGIISVNIGESINISEVITKRHDGDTLATQETVAVVSYILATLVVFPIAVGVGLILRRLIIRNRKVLEESDTSSEISCRKDALNLENGDFKTSIEKAITKLPRIQHLCHEAEKPAPPAPPESRWEFPRDKLRLQTVLGQGNFGQVWKAEADDLTGHKGTTRLVAVKTVKEGSSAREKEDLVRELEIMQQLGNHPNVVTLLGCCTDEEPHYLILEYVMYGKLLAYLRDHRTRQDFYNFSEDSAALTSRDLTVFGYCVARGMEYLASKKIIHRDLAARNVLVDHNKLCKIADFGMSRFANEDGECIETRHGRNALPIRWMAPESLIYSLFTTKTDVWSFGILMWEIVTLGSTPYPDMAAREVMRNVQDGYRLERPSHCRSELFRVIARCWHADPDRRPEFQTLRRDLAQLLEDNMNGHYVDLESFASECTD